MRELPARMARYRELGQRVEPDHVYVQVYDESSREVADAIDVWARRGIEDAKNARIAPSSARLHVGRGTNAGP
jgi:hypothetical protein